MPKFNYNKTITKTGGAPRQGGLPAGVVRAGRPAPGRVLRKKTGSRSPATVRARKERIARNVALQNNIGRTGGAPRRSSGIQPPPNRDAKNNQNAGLGIQGIMDIGNFLKNRGK